MNEIFSSGMILKDISNRVYAKYDTPKGRMIVSALEKCCIPYFARYNSEAVSLTYDSDYADQINEILSKVTAEKYDQLLLELKSSKNTNGYLVLLPEIAEILEMSVGSLKNRPEDIKEDLCRTYVDLWHCDHSTIKKYLSEILVVSISEEQKQFSSQSVPDDTRNAIEETIRRNNEFIR